MPWGSAVGVPSVGSRNWLRQDWAGHFGSLTLCLQEGRMAARKLIRLDRLKRRWLVPLWAQPVQGPPGWFGLPLVAWACAFFSSEVMPLALPQ